MYKNTEFKIRNRKFYTNYFIFSFIFILVFFVSSLILDVDINFFWVMLVFSGSLLVALSNFKKNITLIMFLVCYFIFLLGSYFVYEYFNYSNGVVLFDKYTQKHIYISLLVSLIGIVFGYYLLASNKSNKVIESENNSLYEKSSLLLFYLSYVPNIIIEILRVIKTNEVGYADLYLNDIVKVPYIIGLFAFGCRFYFFCYLSSLPEKKSSRKPIILFIIYSTLTLFTGNRSIFVVNLTLIFIYYVFRSSDFSEEKFWINKKKLLIIIFLAPILLILLDIIGDIRFNNSIFEQKTSSSFYDIFVKQGVSSSVIGFGKVYENILPNRIYSFGSVIEKLKYNPISKILFGYTKYSGNSVERALNGNSFSHIISYLVLPYGYVRGRGLGTSYIAEAYYDYGYIGIFLYSLLYGFILKQCSKYINKSYKKRVAMLLLISSLLMIPRSSADSFLTEFVKTEIIFGVILINIVRRSYFNNSTTNRKI